MTKIYEMLNAVFTVVFRGAFKYIRLTVEIFKNIKFELRFHCISNVLIRIL